ncbi:symmetrical bis(5'-nucleosyl)-tetraphosphatase [Thiopseudomonas alkaliphila]|uniref:symmetrical bis(5'-nucleosyl)-tetraphosphatase n=1 Tax=Thiopseudomonas alkaliphila TaxID=1697053 RepID=UPI0025760D3D|nr:symmetrical bis(5'-nucleosyl)-tetraphosphatase [Thiopseudomonas alkaliphila]MDM1707332.1 symmetrical bis(5'-nucleosyl)-tetraphosphatase [Thiopseudomonas alkaliphila]
MATYAVGDVQGCLTQLQAVLAQVQFNPQHDQLWLVGDLVNRGPDSLATLRFLYQMQDSVITVLGNHDLHLLAAWHDPSRLKRKDTLLEVLQAPDCDELLGWLIQQPLMHYDAQRKLSMVHAGIAPMWSIAQAQAYAEEVHQVLLDPVLRADFFAQMYGNTPTLWSEQLTGMTRLRVITNYFTRMRFCTPQGELDFSAKETLEQAPENCLPWFQVPVRAAAGERIIFGHWAALAGHCDELGLYALDTGCVWGGAMSLMNIDSQQIMRQACPAALPLEN